MSVSALLEVWKIGQRRADAPLDRPLVNHCRERDVLDARADGLEQCDLIRAGTAARLAGDDFREFVNRLADDRVFCDDRIAGLAEHAFARIDNDARAATKGLLVD